MSIYLNQIEQLIALQKVDNVIYDVNKKLNKAPGEVEALKANYNRFEEQKHNIEEKLEHLQEQLKRLENELEETMASAKKSKAKLSKVENEREYNAVSREMTSMEKATKSREEEQAALNNEIVFQNTRLEDVLVLWKEALEEFEQAEANLSTLTKESEEELSVLEKERQTSLVHVPAPVLSRYEFIRRRLKHPVIVPVIEGVCSGCHISIPPQAYNELQRGQQIVSCPNCQRLIYWSAHFQSPEATENENKADTMVFGEDLINN